MPRTRTPRKGSHESPRLRGFARIHLVEHDQDGTPRIVGDSGWVENTICTAGKMQYLAMLLASTLQSKFVRRMAIGTGGAMATNDTAMAGEIADRTEVGSSSLNRQTVAVATASSSTTMSVQFAATWASAASCFNSTHNISNLGLIENSNSGGTFFAVAAFTSSLLNTNQDVQASYTISFA